jgi:hypothetical protein
MHSLNFRKISNKKIGGLVNRASDLYDVTLTLESKV